MIAAILAVAAIGASLMGAKDASRSAKHTDKANAARHKADLMSQFIKRRQMLQQFRMAQAQATAGAVSSGAELESSGYQGVRSALTTNAYYNLNTEERILGQENQAFGEDKMAASAQASAAMWNTVSQVAGIFGGMVGGAPKPSTMSPTFSPTPIGTFPGANTGAYGTISTGPSLLGGAAPESFAPIAINQSSFTP